jgi:hypothetical protein
MKTFIFFRCPKCKFESEYIVDLPSDGSRKGSKIESGPVNCRCGNDMTTSRIKRSIIDQALKEL